MQVDHPLRVLVVDDYGDSLFALAKLVELLGCTVETCQEPNHCLQVARRWQPHLILLDLAMPGHNGFEVAEALRKAHLLPFVLVAISGRGEPAIRARCQAEGFDGFLLKPATVDQLMTLLDLAADRALGAATSADSATAI